MFLFFHFMHLCVFALEKPLILYIVNRHLRRRFEVCFSDKFEQGDFAGAGGADACH